MPGSRAMRLAGAVAVLALLAAPALPGAAGTRVLAHAQLVTSSPGAGAVLPETPEEIRLVFSEPLEAQVTSFDLADSDGQTVLSRVGTVDPEDPFALVLEAPGLGEGIYTLTWRTLSAADGHTAEGFLSFGIGDVGEVSAAGGDDVVHEAAEPSAVIGRWLTYIGLLLAIGLSVFHRVVVRSGPMPQVLVRGIGGALVLSGLATLVAATVSGLEAGGVAEYLTGSRNGVLQLARASVAALGGVALLAVVPARIAGLVAGVTGLAGVVLLVLAGHASGIPGPAAVLSQLVHVTGAAVWIGGIVGLVILARWPRALSEGPIPTMRTTVPRFSALALVSIGLVVLTGIHSAIVQTGVVLDLDTEYGRTLLMKGGFAGGALALGGLNYLDGGRMMMWLDGLRNRVTIELMLATTVLVMTAALASTPPVDEPLGVAIAPIPDAFGTIAPGMSMSIVPGRPGLNRIVVSTTDALAASSLELGLDRLDTGSSTRVPLTSADASASHGGAHISTTGTIDWVADAVVLPDSSSWDTSVRILSAQSGVEMARQRFAFTLSESGIDDGRAEPPLDIVTVIAAALLLFGALGVGLGLGGARLPRCELAASRIALVVGGAVAVILGATIGLGRFVG